jgi:hypothetical protein
MQKAITAGAQTERRGEAGTVKDLLGDTKASILRGAHKSRVKN